MANREASVRSVGDRLPVWGWLPAWLPTLALALMPKCPLCLAALGAVGLASFAAPLYRIGVLPLNVLALLLPLALLAWKARKRRFYGPTLLGVAAASVILGGKFWWNGWQAPWFLGAGLVALGASVVWSARTPRGGEDSCKDCVVSGGVE